MRLTGVRVGQKTRLRGHVGRVVVGQEVHVIGVLAHPVQVHEAAAARRRGLGAGAATWGGCQCRLSSRAGCRQRTPLLRTGCAHERRAEVAPTAGGRRRRGVVRPPCEPVLRARPQIGDDGSRRPRRLQRQHAICRGVRARREGGDEVQVGVRGWRPGEADRARAGRRAAAAATGGGGEAAERHQHVHERGHGVPRRSRWPRWPRWPRGGASRSSTSSGGRRCPPASGPPARHRTYRAVRAR